MKLHSSHVKALITFMCVVTFNYRNGLITVTWYAKWNRTDSAMEDAVVLGGVLKVVEQVRNMIILDSRHGCSAIHQLEAEGGHK